MGNRSTASGSEARPLRSRSRMGHQEEGVMDQWPLEIGEWSWDRKPDITGHLLEHTGVSDGLADGKNGSTDTAGRVGAVQSWPTLG